MKTYRYFIILFIIFLMTACSASGPEQSYIHNNSIELRKYENSDIFSGIISSLEDKIELTKDEINALEKLADADGMKIEYNNESSSITITENENSDNEVSTAYYPEKKNDKMNEILPDPAGADILTETVESDYYNLFVEINYDDAMSYVSKLKKYGFNNSSSMSEDGEIFTYTAYNDDGIYLEFYYALEMGSIELWR